MKSIITRNLVAVVAAAMVAVPSSSAVAENPTGTLRITYFGVSTLLLDDTWDRVLVDGFFSRPGLLATLLAPLSSNPAKLTQGLGDGPPRVRALLVAHAHHDHALDMAAIARREPDAFILGTAATTALGRARNLDTARLRTAEDAVVHRAGRHFEIESRFTPHGPPLPLIGAWIGRAGVPPPPDPSHFTGFSDPHNLSFLIRYGPRRRVLVHPSAGANGAPPLPADIVFIGVGQLSALSPEQIQEYLVSVIGPETRVIVPIHWDAFITPLGGRLRQSPRFLDDVEASFAQLCAFGVHRPDAMILKPDSGSILVLAADGTWRTEGRWSRLCPRPGHPHRHG